MVFIGYVELMLMRVPQNPTQILRFDDNFVLKMFYKICWCCLLPKLHQWDTAFCLMTPHCGFVLDELPWHPGFVCNISADRIMAAVMDDITGAVQRGPAEAVREGQSWAATLHARGTALDGLGPRLNAETTPGSARGLAQKCETGRGKMRKKIH